MTDMAHLLPVLSEQRVSPPPSVRCGGSGFQDDFGEGRIVFQLRQVGGHATEGVRPLAAL